MKAPAIDRVLSLLQDVQPAGKSQYKARCPAHDDNSPSLSIGFKNGAIGLHCHAGCSVEAVCKAIGIKVADLGGRKRAAKSASRPKPLILTVPPLCDAELAEARTAAGQLGPHSLTGYRLKSLFPYRTAKGSVWCYRARYDSKSGEKQILPFHRSGADWVKGEPRAPRGGKPLYCLPEMLATDGPVLVVEGEKCVDALRALGLAATTSGGANSAGKADWSPLVGRNCIIWPDNDEPGDGYAADVGEALAALGCAVTCVDLAALGLPGDGYDAADWLQDNPKAKARDVLALPTVAHSGVVAVELVCAADIEEKSVHWLQSGWLARGALHILAGDGGTGKTTLAVSYAAVVSSGGTWPDGSKAPVGHVLIWTGEDDISRVLVPRLRAAGADLSKIHFAMGTKDRDGVRPFDPATDMDVLEAQARQIKGGVALVIVDPIANAVTGDSHKNNDVRRSLQPVVNLASSLQAAVIGISHFSKNTQGRNVSDRVVGSVAFKNFARVVMVTAKGKDGDCRLVRSKSNLGPDGDGFTYRIEVEQREYDLGRNDVSRVVWGEPLFGYARELLDQVEGTRTQRDEAADWLYSLLHGKGAVPYKEIEALAHEDGIAKQTLERAKKALGVISKRSPKEGGGRGEGVWSWKLPESGREAAMAAQSGGQARKKPVTKYSG